MISHLQRRIFSFPVFLGACLVLVAFGNTSMSDLAAGKAYVEGDTWWHVAVGEQILSTHTWPTTDPYSFTVQGNPWIAYQWLGEVPMALATRWGGLPGLAVLLVILAGAFALLLYYHAWLCSGDAKAAALACLAVLPLTGTFFTLRPQLPAFCFLIITMTCLEHFRRGRSAALWVLPGIFLLWVNTHGSFPVGFLVLALYWLCGFWSFQCGSLMAERWTPGQRRRLLLTILLCVLALLVTPYGTRLATYPLELAVQQPEVTRVFTEWRPMDFSTSYGLWFLLFLLLILLWQVLFPIRYRAEILAFLLFTIVESCLHRRFLIFFVMTFTPILAMVLARWMPGPQKDRPMANAVLTGLALAIIVTLIPSQRKLNKVLVGEYPFGAVEYLRRHPIPTGMFNEDTWGGFLIWSLGPQHKVFIDDRGDIYEYGGVLVNYARIKSMQGDPLPLLRGYGIRACLLHQDSPMVTLLANSPDWRRVYEDRVSTIFMHNGATP